MLKRISLYLLSALLLTSGFNSSFAQSNERKTAYGILIDNTGSLYKQFPQVVILGKGVVKHTNKRGPISLFNFILERDTGSFIIPHSEDAYEGGNHDRAVVTLGVEWSQDEGVLSQYIESISVVKGHTDLFGAIHSMTEALNAKVSAEKDAIGDKVIILITDGEHRPESLGGSSYSTDDERRKQEKQLIKLLKESGIRVYAVGLVRELNAYGGFGGMTTKEKAMTFLEKMTKETKGRVIFPKSKKIDVDTFLAELLAQ